MARHNIDPSQLSSQDMAELGKMNEARRKQEAAGKVKAQALANHVPPPDPTQPPAAAQQQQAPQLTTPGQINLSQQVEIDAADSVRKEAMEAQMRAVRAGQAPYAAGSTIDIAQHAATAAGPGAPQTAPAVAGMFTVWRAIRQEGDERKLVNATLVYADDWLALRTALKTEKDGDWLAIHYQFPANVPNILGFFVELRSPYKQPGEAAVVEKFDVIVKGARIFRSEIEPEVEPEPESEPEPEPEPEPPEKT